MRSSSWAAARAMTVNDGWFDATVTAIVDGRNGSSVEVPS